MEITTSVVPPGVEAATRVTSLLPGMVKNRRSQTMANSRQEAKRLNLRRDQQTRTLTGTGL